jgi:hypothetical protein
MHTRQQRGTTAYRTVRWAASITLLLLPVLLLTFLGGLAAPLAAQTSDAPIDFETIPGATAQEGLVISDQFAATHGVTFQLEGGGNPVLAEVGSPVSAFLGPPNDTTPDTPLAGQNIGQYFLTDDGSLNTSSSNLIIRYDPPTAAASGIILDIDSSEVFTIEARGASDAVLQTITVEAGDPGTGDGRATRWSFSRMDTDIASLRFVGERPVGNFGLGFDNFSARTPATFLYLPLIQR